METTVETTKEEALIEKAIEALGPITYEPFYVAYFVTMNERDMGNSDYCINCIGKEVKKCRKEHREERAKIIAKFDFIEANGFFKVGKKKVKVAGKYTPEEIKKAKRFELKKYPAKASFGYEGHDPDFGGGLTEPCSCAECGEHFQCEFNPDKSEMDYLESLINHDSPLTPMNKWEIEAALRYYTYCEDNIKPRLLKLAETLLIKNPI